jgi:hypothetical protein
MAAAKASLSGGLSGGLSDKKFVLWLGGGLLLVILLVSFLVPSTDDSDPMPTTYNAGSAGIKAAYLLLGDLGYDAQRWEGSTSDLGQVDAAKTTLILANPYVAPEDTKDVQASVADFLARGGRVLVTGVQGAYLLPGAHTGSPTQLYKALCFTTPEGQGPLAQAGKVTIDDDARWSDTGMESRVEQWCGNDAVVVRYKVGESEAVWWSSPLPMTNRGLKEDASLKLLLASIGPPGRTILFDESLHGARESVWETAKGLPIRSLAWQAAFVALLLVLSFGRRSGPLWLPLKITRSSPLEFAESMGHLYNKAGATQVATEGARRRVLRYLHERCGVPQAILKASPQEIVEALQARFGGDWSGLATHLAQAEAEEDALSSRTALELVKALDKDVEELEKRVSLRRG